MKINIIYYSILILLFTLVSSCIDDKGNYDYQDAENIISVTISDLPEEVVTSREISLTPTVSNLKEGIEYSYRWFCHLQTPQPVGKNEMIELGTDKDLIRSLPLPLASYYLFMEVRDVKANVFVRKKIELEISATAIKGGWYFLKDIDNATDFDYITTKGDQYSNVLKDHSVGNLRLPGNAVQFSYQSRLYTHQIIEGGNVIETLSGQAVFHVASDQEYSVIRATTMEPLKKFENAFYEVPAIKKIQAVEHHSAAVGTIMLNAGKMHTIAHRAPNIGLLNYPEVLEQEYEFAGTRSLLNSTHALAFDKKSRAFRKVAFDRGIITSFSDKIPQPGENASKIASPNNMNADMIEILPGRVEYTGAAQRVTGVAFMKNTSKNEHYLALIELFSSTPYPFLRVDTITDSTLPVLSSPYRAATREGQFIYYTRGNELRSYNYAVASSSQPSTQRDQLVKTYPGEEVTYVLNYLLQTSATVKFDYLFVATSTASGKWKVYQYLIPSAGDPIISGEPLNVYEGEGRIKEIIYRR